MEGTLFNIPEVFEFLFVSLGLTVAIWGAIEVGIGADDAETEGTLVEDVARAANCSLRTLQTLTIGVLAGSIVVGKDGSTVELVADDGGG